MADEKAAPTGPQLVKQIVGEIAAMDIALSDGRRIRLDLPHFGQQRPRQVFISGHLLVEARDNIPRNHWSGPHHFGHPCAETEAPGVIPHPSRLECGILPIVGKHKQTLAFGMMDHVLRKNMHIRHVDGSDRLGRFAKASGE